MITSLFSHKKIGIWGFGKTGQSFLSLCAQYQPETIAITQEKPLDNHQQALLEGHNAQWVPYDLLPYFLEAYDLILPSPGIDLSSYQDYQHKFVSELDIFSYLVTVPTIAITGSVGKTTTVTFLTELLNKLGKKALACGNIGVPLLDIVATQKEYDLLVLELSSFQLEQSTRFAPDYAALTNLFENHLDRHKTMDAYARSKGKLFSFQHSAQHAVIPLEYYDQLWDSMNHQQVQWLTDDYLIDIIKPLSAITAVSNWQIIFALLDTLGLSLEDAARYAPTLMRPEHRMQLVTTHNGIHFYNDSKSTVPAATLQALKQVPADSPVLLFLGGVDKGVDRQLFCHGLKDVVCTIKQVICFGKQADLLAGYCTQVGLPVTAHTTVTFAFEHALSLATSGDTVLFSPSGASFDLYTDYQARGRDFVRLVHQYAGRANK